MKTPRSPRLGSAALLLFVALTALAACGGGAGPSPTPIAPSPTPIGPSPTPIADPVLTPRDAAARVAASDQRFLGIAELNPDVIGASAWWTADSIADGGFRITYIVGWGDCPAGCINKHQWIFEVTADGAVTLADESGEPVPGGSFQP